MFHSKTTKLSFAQHIIVSYVCTALNGSFVALCKQEGRPFTLLPDFHIILHLDQQGSILHQYHLPEGVNHLSMPNQNQVIVPLFKNKKILKIDLVSFQEKSIPFEFEGHYSTLELYMFRQSSLTCVKETDQHYPPSFMKLTYFNTQNLESGKVLEYTKNNKEAEKKEAEVFYKVFQGNSRSMVIFANHKKYDIFSFHTFQVDISGQSDKPIMRSFSMKFPEQESNLMISYELREVQKGEVVMLVSGRSREVFLTSFKLEQKSIKRKSFVVFPDKEKRPYVSVQGCKVNIVFLDDYICMRQHTLNSVTRERLEKCPLHMIGSKLDFKEFREKEENLLQKEEISCDFDGNLLIQNEVDKEQGVIRVKEVRVIQSKEMFLQFLLHLDEDFDDDLLLDALKELECIS